MRWLITVFIVLAVINGCEEENGAHGNANDGNTTGSMVSNGYVLTAWNDLGMHCMDGNDYSVFSILPPYNNLHAQLKDKKGHLITRGVTLTYQATTGVDGQINTDSASKTNFWQFSNKLFPGSNLPQNTGLAGNKNPSTTPHNLQFNTTQQWWEAEGIPLTPYNDNGSKNYYPLVKVTAKDRAGNILAEAKAVLPISDEMDCKRCHASGSPALDAKPNSGWVNNADPEKDFKLNILRLHDQKFPNAVSRNLSKLQAKGYSYQSSGLEATVNAGTPILCASCHSSNALPGSGVSGVKPLTQAIHGLHARVNDPQTGLSMDSSQNRNSCYACHPGQATKCLRGAMGDLKDSSGNSKIQCQSCHGTLSKVGSSTRKGWFDEPNCQACHHDGKAETSAVTANGTLKSWADKRFATNANTPAQGVSLYRFSKGHGNLQCEACHGSPHAIYPAHTPDNLLSKGIQGHIGTIGECASCHSTIPDTVSGGPHGMHPVGNDWVRQHGDKAEHGGRATCAACHGTDYRGSQLSKMWTTRTLNGKTFSKGHAVSCYDCHNGPGGGD